MTKRKRKKRVKNGSLTHLSNGSWQGRVCIGRTNEGPMYQTITRQSKEELESLILYQRLLYSRSKLSGRSKMTLEEWSMIWLDDIKYCLIGETTYMSYKSVIKTHIIPFLGSKKLFSIRKEDIERFIGHLQSTKNGKKALLPSSVKGAYMIINQILDAAVGAKLLIDNPAEGITLPKSNHQERKVFTSEEVKKFFDIVKENNPEWYDVFYFELMTGLRRGEMFGLMWKDINLQTGEVQIRRTIKYLHRELIITKTKTNSGKRKIILPESVREILVERRKIINSKWVFPRKNNEELPIEPTVVYDYMKKLLSKADLPYVQFHNLRHTFATQAISNGVEPATLSNLMGHKIMTFTLDTYTHKTKDMEKGLTSFIKDYLDDVKGGVL